MGTERQRAILELVTEGDDRLISDLARVEQALGKVFRAGEGGRQLLQDLDPGKLARFESVTRGQQDDVLRAQIRAYEAQLNSAQVQRRAGLEIGSKKGYATEEARRKAITAAAEQELAAQSALNKLLDGINASAQKELYGYRAKEEAVLRQAQAANKQAVLDEKAVNDARVRQNRADAMAAFSQMQDPRQRALSDEEINAITSRPTRYASDTDLVYSKRVAQADAASALANAESKLLRAVEAAQRGEGEHAVLTEKLGAAVRARDAAERTLTAATQKLAAAESNAALVQAENTRKSFREDFITGFRGRRGDATYAEQFGQAAKFSILYGTAYKALFAITQTLQNAVQEGIEFQDSLTNLSIASNRPKEQLDKLATELAKASTDAGFAPSQGLEIGARSLGLYGAVDSPVAEQDRVARISAQVVSRLAIGSKKSPVELQGDIAAIGQALGLGAEGQFRIADLDAYLTKKFGVQQGSTLQAVSEAGTVGKAAGFTDEQLFAIAADMISRTGQTSSAVSGFMAQIFSRGGEGSLTSVAQKYGVDPNQKLADVLSRLAEIYQTADPQQRNEIAAAFGRGKVQNAAVALLGDYDEVQAQAAKARTESTGAADKQFNEHMRNIGGEIAQLGGDLKDFSQLLGASGILDGLGLVVVVLDHFVEGVNDFLRVWNQLPDVVRDAIIAIGLWTAATKTGAAQAVLGGFLGTRGGVGSAVAGLDRGLAMAGAGRGLAATEDAVLRGAAGAPARTGLAAIGRAGAAAAASIGPWGLAIGGLLALASLKSSADHLREAQEATRDELSSGVERGATANDYRARADALAADAERNRSAAGRVEQFLTFGHADDEAQRQAQVADRTASLYREIADRMDARQSGVEESQSLFTDFSKSGLDAVFENLVNQGASAKVQMDLLSDAINGLGGKAKTTATKVDPKALGDQLTGELVNPVEAALQSAFDGLGLSGKDAKLLRKQFQIDPSKIGEKLRSALVGVTDASQLDDSALDQIATSVTGTVADPDSGVGKAVHDAVLKALKDKIQAEYGAVLGTRILTPEETLSAIQEAMAKGQAAAGELPQTDLNGRLRNAKQTLSNVLKARASGSTNDTTDDSVLKAIATARADVVQAQVDRLEALRKVALRSATTRGGALAASHALIRQEIQAVVKGGNADQLAQIIESAGKGAASMARQAIMDALAVARAAAAANRTIEVTAMSTATAAEHSLAVAGKGAKASADVKRLEQMLQALSQTASGTNDSEISGFGGGGGGAGGGTGDTAAQIAAARAQARAAHNGGEIASARAAIASARADLADAKKGTVAYYNALGSLYQAQQQLADAIRSYQHNQGLLRIDATNPLKVAQLEAREAARKLRQDRRAGRGKDVIAQDRVDLQSAQANAEQTKFEQRLSSVQTADELGRISHTKYLAYLQHEHDRLEGIKHRTYQQQQQLDEVDRLMQEAAKQMQGQFNIGDIKLPTPYQVRRYIAQASGANPAGSGTQARTQYTDARTVTIHIDGTASEKVRRIVREEAGKGARVTTTATRRRG